jgi:hypothetical protein
MARTIQFVVGLFLWIAIEVGRIYFIMPFPGSQEKETIELAYFLHENIFWLRTIALLILVIPTVQFFLSGSSVSKWYVGIAISKMFYPLKTKEFTSGSETKIGGDQLVLGVSINGEAKAYPIEVIGYHHQVNDTVGNQPVLITYCTVCRTGRAYKPIVNGQPESFRLVGMDHFNAMFEDKTTGSWWRQVNGEAIAGPLKGSTLEEVYAQQMTLRAWLDANPLSKVLAADTTFQSEYESLSKYDEGTKEGMLEGRDSLSWKEKSWVVGVKVNGQSKAYDWNHLVEKKVVNDVIDKTRLLVAIEADSMTFHVWERDTLVFVLDSAELRDKNTGSSWNWNGRSVSGPLKDSQLKALQSYQEFWHSWRTFNPTTTTYPTVK